MTTTLLDSQKGQVDHTALLGRIMWYSVPDKTFLNYKEVVAELTTLGLTKALPGYPEDYNVFRRASKAAERRRVPHANTTDQFENWMIRNVAGVGEDTITRRIVVEVVDPKGRRLEYDQIADIEYDKNLKRVRFLWLNGHSELSHPTAKEIMAETQVNFYRWRGKLNDQVLREWIRKTILRMGAVAVRPSGGVYFLEEKFAGQVEALEAFVRKMFPVGSDCHSVEIPDNAKQRDMVKLAIENETVGEIERLMAEIATVKKEGHLTPKAYFEMLGDVRKLENKMNGYTKLLKRDMSAVQSRLTILEGMAKGLAPMQGRKKREVKPKIGEANDDE